MVIERKGKLTPAQRGRAQRHILLGNLIGNLAHKILGGQYMMLFATDVLQLNAQSISAIIGLSPLTSLIRLPFLRFINRMGKVRTLIWARLLQALVALVLLLIPAREMSFYIFAAAILLYFATREIGIQTVLEPIIRLFTRDKDRGRFLARMRFSFTTVGLVAGGLFIFYVGSAITEFQYKILLVVCLLGFLNSCFWMRFLPREEKEEAAPAGKQSGGASLWWVLRNASVMRIPLLIRLVTTSASLPMLVIYFRQMLDIPSNLIALFIFFQTAGQTLTFHLWGRISDTIGSRPTLTGLLLLSALNAPLFILIPPFVEFTSPPSGSGPDTLVIFGVFLGFGFFRGMLMSGRGIALSSIEHHHVTRENSLEAFNLFKLVQVVYKAGLVLFAGYYLQNIVLPHGMIAVWENFIYIDWFKAYLGIFAPLLMLSLIPLVLYLPDFRPGFGVGDFFSALFNSPWRTIYASKDLYNEDKERRADLARRLGIFDNPIAIDTLLSLLQDPSYNVKVETIRSLARTNSETVGEKLKELLADEEFRSYWDQIAWALGELEYQPAFDLLVERLQPEMSTRTRAMAARALGNLGDARAIPCLVETLLGETTKLHLVSSCSQALLQLEAKEHAKVVFHTQIRLGNREERYEMMNILCQWLNLPTHWLLMANSKHSAEQCLLRHLDWQTESWIEKRKNIITPFKLKDHEAIRLQFEKAIAEADQTLPVEHALAGVLAETGQWSPLSVLAAAWLLYRDN